MDREPGDVRGDWGGGKGGEGREQRGVGSPRVSADGEPEALQGKYTLHGHHCACSGYHPLGEEAVPSSPLLKESTFVPHDPPSHSSLDKNGS